jgi:hypothetical protein
MLKFGDIVQDSITGFSGTFTAQCTYLHGTPQLLIERCNEKVVSEWFDASRVVPVKVKG